MNTLISLTYTVTDGCSTREVVSEGGFRGEVKTGGCGNLVPGVEGKSDSNKLLDSESSLGEDMLL